MMYLPSVTIVAVDGSRLHPSSLISQAARAVQSITAACDYAWDGPLSHRPCQVSTSMIDALVARNLCINSRDPRGSRDNRRWNGLAAVMHEDAQLPFLTEWNAGALASLGRNAWPTSERTSFPNDMEASIYPAARAGTEEHVLTTSITCQLICT